MGAEPTCACGCNQPVAPGRKWKRGHNNRTPEGRERAATLQRSPLRERFLAKVKRMGDHWIWTGAKSSGIGQIRVNGRRENAPRGALRLAGVDIPAGAYVRNACGERLCVNPDHLVVTKPGPSGARERRRERWERSQQEAGD
jgi:hypothetical protein